MNTLNLQTAFTTQVASLNLIDSPIETEVLDELRETLGEELLAQIIDTYLGYAPNQMTKLQDAAQRMDIEALWKAAHSFKSSSRSVGANHLGELCEKLERLGRAAETMTALALVPTLKQEYLRTIEYLQTLLD